MRRWFASSAPVWSAPPAAVANGQTVCSAVTPLLITASSTAVIAVSPSSGAVLYSSPIAGITGSLIIDASDTIYATKAAALGAISASSGNTLWELSTAPLQTRGMSMDSDGSVLVGTTSGKLLRFSPQCAPGYCCPPANPPPKCCTLCSAGTFSNFSLAQSCTPCPAGTFSSKLGATSCQACPGGHFCPAGTSSWARLNCGRGNWCADGTAAPNACPIQVVPPPFSSWEQHPLKAQGPAFLVETASCLGHCFWNFTSGDGMLIKC